MTEGGTVEVAGRTIPITFPDGPPVTRARVSAADMAEPPATRETPARGPNSDRPGQVTGVEQHQLRGSLGWLICGERAARGWSQEVLAERTRVGLITVRDLKSGRVRPSDRMTRRLAEALGFDRGRGGRHGRRLDPRRHRGPAARAARRHRDRFARSYPLNQSLKAWANFLIVSDQQQLEPERIDLNLHLVEQFLLLRQLI